MRRRWPPTSCRLLHVAVHEEHAVLDQDRVGAHGFPGRRAGRGPGTQVESGRMQRALHEAALQPAVGEGGVLVSAGGVDGVERAVRVEYRDGNVGENPNYLAGWELVQRAYPDHSHLRCALRNWRPNA